MGLHLWSLSDHLNEQGQPSTMNKTVTNPSHINQVGVGKHFPPEEPSLLFKMGSYLMVSVIIMPAVCAFMNLLNRTRIIGKENMAGLKPPWILASNHLTLLDDLFLEPLLLFPKSLYGYKYIPYHAPEERNFYKHKLISWFMRQSKSIPLVRGKGLHQIGMDRLIKAVGDHGILHIFPEGTRSRTGNIGDAKPGIGRIVCDTGAKVLPVYHQGLEKVLPIGKGIPRIGKVIRISIGKPLQFNQKIEPGKDVTAWKEISKTIIEAIHEQREIANRKWGYKKVITSIGKKTVEEYD